MIPGHREARARLTVGGVRDALTETHGNVRQCAIRFGVSPGIIRTFLEREGLQEHMWACKNQQPSRVEANRKKRPWVRRKDPERHGVRPPPRRGPKAVGDLMARAKFYKKTVEQAGGFRAACAAMGAPVDEVRRDVRANMQFLGPLLRDLLTPDEKRFLWDDPIPDESPDAGSPPQESP